MKKKQLLVLALMALSSLNLGAKDFYEFDNVQPQTILELFLKAQKAGRTYPTNAEFAAVGISAADIEFIRSHVRKNELVNTDDRLNTALYKDRKVFMCIPMGNGSQGAHGYPTNSMARTDVYSMWNYTSNFGSWNHGFFQTPGSWADAAHKNGCRLMSGQMFFEKMYGGADDKPWVDLISKKENGKYIYVEPMLNALMFFGHDGIVYNWEAYRNEDADVIAFHKALYKEAKARGFADYNSLIYTSTNFTLDEDNYGKLYGTKDEPIHELFLNYPGGYIQTGLKDSEKFAEETCKDISRLYAGVHINSMSRNWEELKQTTKMNLIVWGEHTANMIYTNTKGTTDDEWQTNYQMMQERFFSGGHNNPAYRPDASQAMGTTWQSQLAAFCGLSEYMPERSAISKAFLTHFNLGNGNHYYYKGAPVTEGGWYNMASQDIVPTYRWLVYDAGTETANKTFVPTFTHAEAYVGGTCLSLKGNAGNTGVDVVLYKTDVTLGAHPVARVALKRVAGNATVALLLKVNGAWQEYAVDATAAGWNEKTINLDKLNGGKIQRVALRVKGDADVLVGKLELNDNRTIAPKPIKELVSAETVSESATDITLKLHWTVDAPEDKYGRSYNDDNNIDHFEIFIKKDNEEIEVGRTSQWATIAAHIPFSADAEKLTIGVRAVSTDLHTASPIVWKEVSKGQPDEVIDPNDTSGQGPHYQVNYNKKAPHGREDRYMMHVGLYEGEGNKKNNLQQYPDNTLTARITKQFYLDVTNKVVFDVVAGQTYTPYIAYHGLWMSGYVFVDWNNDGVFDSTKGLTFNNNLPTRTDDCEVVSFSAHAKNDNGRWYNSNGKPFDKGGQFPQDDNVKNWLGSFKVPANLKEGIYRMRFKLDWNSLDPKGSDEILQDGGDIIDVLVNVHKDVVKVGAKAENGTVANGAVVLSEALNSTSGYKQPVSVTFKAAEGYQLVDATVRHGYNLLNESGLDEVGNRQWWAEKLEVSANSSTIPASLVNANVLVLPNFSAINGIDDVKVSKEELLENDVYNLNGQLVRRAGSKKALPLGVYVVKGKKFIVK